jgi:hypothetical protein
MRGPIAVGVVVLCASCDHPSSTVSLGVDGTGTISFTRRGSPSLSLTCAPDCGDTYPDQDRQGWRLIATPGIGADFVSWVANATSPSYGKCLASDAHFPVEILSGATQYVCSARFAACQTSDGEDLANDPLGDPTLDLRCITSGVDPDTDEPWVRVGTMALWPPPDVYSWYTKITLFSAAGEIGSYTVQLHDGVMSTLVTGSVVDDATLFAPNPMGAFGYLVAFDPTIDAPITNVTVETGIEKTNNPPDFRMDGPVLESPFDRSARGTPVTTP